MFGYSQGPVCLQGQLMYNIQSVNQYLWQHCGTFMNSMLLIECLCVSRVGFIYLVHVSIRIDYEKYIYLNINSVSIRNYADVYIYGVYESF